MNEINAAIKVAKKNNCEELSLLHCVSGYPTPLEQCNLKAINTLKSLDENIKIGWSDHSKNPDVLNRAINHWNAELIEFHLDLDGEGGEFETIVVSAPHMRRDVILEGETFWKGSRGSLEILSCRLS